MTRDGDVGTLLLVGGIGGDDFAFECIVQVVDLPVDVSLHSNLSDLGVDSLAVVEILAAAAGDLDFWPEEPEMPLRTLSDLVHMIETAANRR